VIIERDPIIDVILLDPPPPKLFQDHGILSSGNNEDQKLFRARCMLIFFIFDNRSAKMMLYMYDYELHSIKVLNNKFVCPK